MSEERHDATDDALKLLVLDTRDKVQALERWVTDPTTGTVVRLGKAEDAVSDLRRLGDEDREKLRRALDVLEKRPTWLERHKEVVVALVGSGGAIAVLASALGSCG